MLAQVLESLAVQLVGRANVLTQSTTAATDTTTTNRRAIADAGRVVVVDVVVVAAESEIWRAVRSFSVSASTVTTTGNTSLQDQRAQITEDVERIRFDTVGQSRVHFSVTFQVRSSQPPEPQPQSLPMNPLFMNPVFLIE